MKFTDLLKEYNIPIAPEGNEHTSSGYINIDCPFCGKNTYKYHMGYSISGGFTTCWKCGHHSLFSVIKELTGLSTNKVKQLLKNLDAIPKQTIEYEHRQLVLPKGLQPLQKPHEDYLIERGYDVNEIEQLWKVQGLGIAGKLSWRIFIPVYYKGKILSWTTRAIGNNEKRYINASDNESLVSIHQLVYGIDYVRSTAIIFEGPFDAWRVGPGACALFGIKFTTEQVKILSKIQKRYICFDAEVQAQKQAQKLCKLLGALDGTTYLIEPEEFDSKDVGEASNETVKELRRLLK